MLKTNEPMRLTVEHVALCERPEIDHGPDARLIPLTEADFDLLVDRLTKESGAVPLWIFAYGSLIWNPSFTAVEECRATAIGWHRSFCIELRSWRGTPSQPGLMMGLDNGGRCNGVAYRMADGDRRGAIYGLLKREMAHHQSVRSIRWIPLLLDGKIVRSLVFYAGPRGFNITRRLLLGEVARRLARACGHKGSGAAYLYTIVKLEEYGIRDRNLWRLQAMVAAEIEAINQPRRAE